MRLLLVVAIAFFGQAYGQGNPRGVCVLNCDLPVPPPMISTPQPAPSQPQLPRSYDEAADLETRGDFKGAIEKLNEAYRESDSKFDDLISKKIQYVRSKYARQLNDLGMNVVDHDGRSLEEAISYFREASRQNPHPYYRQNAQLAQELNQKRPLGWIGSTPAAGVGGEIYPSTLIVQRWAEWETRITWATQGSSIAQTAERLKMVEKDIQEALKLMIVPWVASCPQQQDALQREMLAHATYERLQMLMKKTVDAIVKATPLRLTAFQRGGDPMKSALAVLAMEKDLKEIQQRAHAELSNSSQWQNFDQSGRGGSGYVHYRPTGTLNKLAEISNSTEFRSGFDSAPRGGYELDTRTGRIIQR